MSTEPTNNNNFNPNNNSSESEKQMDIQNLNLQNNTQGNNIDKNNNNQNQDFNMFQNSLSSHSNEKMSIDSLNYNPNLIANISGVGNNDQFNNISPNKSLNYQRDSNKNNFLFPSQIDRKTIGDISNIDNRMSEYLIDPNFDIGLNLQRSSLEDTLQMTANKNSQMVLSNNIFQSNRNSFGILSGRYSNGQPLNSMFGNNLLFSNNEENKLFFSGNQQVQSQSNKLNLNQLAFNNPQNTQQIQPNPDSLDKTQQKNQDNSQNGMIVEQDHFEKYLKEQQEQINTNFGDMIESIGRNSNQIGFSSQIGANFGFYDFNQQGTALNQFRFDSGIGAGNIGAQTIPINVLNPHVKSMVDGNTLNFGIGRISTIEEQNFDTHNLERQFDSFTLKNLKTENNGENQLLKNADEGTPKAENDNKFNSGRFSNYPNIGRITAFQIKQEVDQENNIYSGVNPFEENNENRLSITNDSINRNTMHVNDKMSINSNIMNRSLGNNIVNSGIKHNQEEQINSFHNDFNGVKHEKQSIDGFGEIGSGINFQNNSFNLSGFPSGRNFSLDNRGYVSQGGNFSQQRGSNLLNQSKNNRISAINRISNGTIASESNRISFPTFDYDQQKFQETGAPQRDENGSLIQQSNRSSAINSESVLQDEEEKNKKKVEEVTTCHCGKTKCLKLYCVCFQQGLLCTEGCRCTECQNTIEFMDERERAINAIKLRQPDAFEKKVNIIQDQIKKIEEEDYEAIDSVQPNQQLAHKKGCNCKKSFCRKKYCECFNEGVKCTYLCRCEACQNGKNECPEQQSQHINIEGVILIDQENFNKENNAYGNIKLEVFRPAQQFITKIEGSGYGDNNLDDSNRMQKINVKQEYQSNNQNTNENNQGQINMENDDQFNIDKLNHSRFTISELENNFTHKKKQKNNEENFLDAQQQEQQTFEQVFSYNEQKQVRWNLNYNNESINSNNRNSEMHNNLSGIEINRGLSNYNNSINNNIDNEQQLQMQCTFSQQMMAEQDSNFRNNSLNNQSLNKNPSNENGFDFSTSFDQNNEDSGSNSQKNKQFINMRRGTADNTDFTAL